MFGKALFTSTLYVQIREHRIKVVDIQSGKLFDQRPLVAVATSAKGVRSIAAVGDAAARCVDAEVINPFSHPRTLLKDFALAEKLFLFVVKTLNEGSLLRPSPRVVVHPMEKLEGGLTEVERRAFQLLALGAGAWDVVVYVGAPLMVQTLDFDALKRQENLG